MKKLPSLTGLQNSWGSSLGPSHNGFDVVLGLAVSEVKRDLIVVVHVVEVPSTTDVGESELEIEVVGVEVT